MCSVSEVGPGFCHGVFPLALETKMSAHSAKSDRFMARFYTLFFLMQEDRLGGRRRGHRCPLGFGLPIHCSFQVMSTSTGMLLLMGMASNSGGLILKSETVVGMVPTTRTSFPSGTSLKGTLL